MTPNYHRRPLVAHLDNGVITEWLTPDGYWRVRHFKETNTYDVDARECVRIADEPMRVIWEGALEQVPRAAVTEFLNVILYPFGSEPSPESPNDRPLGENWPADHDDVAFIEREGGRHE